MGLRTLAQYLWPWPSNPAADLRPAGLGTLAPATDLPCRPERDRRTSVGVAAAEESPYGKGVTLVARQR
jgi:hypothetical protein